MGHSIDCAGTADFIRDFGIDLARMLEDAFGQEARGSDDVPDPSLVGPRSQPRADLVTPLLVGFVTYLFSWTAKTFLDEVYGSSFSLASGSGLSLPTSECLASA